MKRGLHIKRKERLLSRVKEQLSRPKEWSMGFVSDALSYGHRVRIFNVIDDCNHEILAIECGVGFSAELVIRVFTQLEEEIGLPKKIRVGNGPEFTSHAFQNW
jgi:putative transposase